VDVELCREALTIATSKQQRYDFNPPSAQKMEAKTFARDALYAELTKRGIDPMAIEVLDVGHEPFYAHLFHKIKAANLPEFDMHNLAPAQSEAILAMHVLEHSR
jgi:hypothetical protein